MSSYEEEGGTGFMTEEYEAAAYSTSYTEEQALYGPDDGTDLVPGFAMDQKPKILLMGLRRSGKSSIQNVVFHKMSPNETVFLESTNKITTNDIANAAVVQFKILDFPGQIDFFDPSFNTEKIFGGVGALVFVIDAQDDYLDAVAKLGETVSRVFKINPKLRFEVFIHKVDGLTDDTKIETQRDIHQKACDDLHEASLGVPGLDNVHLNFYLTSIYDHSIFEAFSKVVQKLIPQLPTLENLLTIFNSNSGIEKSFLFDVSSKIYMATDYAPVDMQSYELCCDMIDVVLDISYIYGMDDDSADHMSCFDSSTYSVIKLNNNTVLLMWQIAPYLALVCILREENYTRPGLIEYNYNCFRKGLLEIFEVRNKFLKIEQEQYEQKLRLARNNQISEGGSSSEGGDQTNASSQLQSNSPQGSEKVYNAGEVGVDDSKISNRQPNANGTRRESGSSQMATAGDDGKAPTAYASEGRRKFSSNDAGSFSTSNAPSRALSDGVNNSRGAGAGDNRASQLRHASAVVDSEASGLPVRELVTGQFIRSGGPDNVTAPAPGGTVGNTFIMTDDTGMVLVNGTTNTTDANS